MGWPLSLGGWAASHDEAWGLTWAALTSIQLREEAARARGGYRSMARSGGTSGDWLLLEEFFARGGPRFVGALRAVGGAEAVGAFAPRWIADPRPEARALLFDYLDRPLNAFRHEALV